MLIFSNDIQLLNLVDNNVRSCEEQCDGGDDGEERERDETQTVEHHGGKLPVVLDGRGVLVVADLVRYDANLLKDQAELAVDSWRELGGRWRAWRQGQGVDWRGRWQRA